MYSATVAQTSSIASAARQPAVSTPRPRRVTVDRRSISRISDSVTSATSRRVEVVPMSTTPTRAEPPALLPLPGSIAAHPTHGSPGLGARARGYRPEANPQGGLTPFRKETMETEQNGLDESVEGDDETSGVDAPSEEDSELQEDEELEDDESAE